MFHKGTTSLGPLSTEHSNICWINKWNEAEPRNLMSVLKKFGHVINEEKKQAYEDKWDNHVQQLGVP